MTTDFEASLSDLGYAKVIVALKPQAAAAAAGAVTAAAGVAAVAAASAAAAMEAELSSHFMAPDQTQAVRLAFAASRAASKALKRGKPAERKVRVFPRLGLAVGYVDRQGAASLAADSRVERVVPAPEVSLIRPVTTVAAATPSAQPTWGIKRLRVPELWAAGLTGKGVIVGHLDTGYDATHPALADALHEFAEFDLMGDRVPNAKPWDSDQITPAHGSHTAGTIAGRPTSQGTIGVAPEAKLASGLVIEGGQVIDRILSGMDWVLSEGARILSLSLGLRGFTLAFQVIIDALRAHNVLPVIAVGNEGILTSRSPGNYVNVVSVGASNSVDMVADFSGSQTFQRAGDPLVPDLVGPGVDVISCAPNKRYGKLNGSSMATPHVAGLAALLLQARPGATADELEAAIFSSCRLPSNMLAERGNRGVPDAVEAFTKLTGQPPVALATAMTSASKRRGARARKRAGRKKALARSPARKPASRSRARRVSRRKATRKARAKR